VPWRAINLDEREAANRERCGPKAANLALMRQAGLPTPPGFVVEADVYHRQLASLGLAHAAASVGSDDGKLARRAAIQIKLALLEGALLPEIEDGLLHARQQIIMTSTLLAVRSSALVEDRAGSSFAGQFDSYIGIATERDFITAVRSCWAALWATRVLRYMAAHGIDAASTAMAVLLQPVIPAQASGGGLSQTAGGGMRLTATWGLGETIAQGEITPDRYELDASDRLIEVVAGHKDHSVSCEAHGLPIARAVPRSHASVRCLSNSQVAELAQLLRRAADLMQGPVEIEWALDFRGITLLQARPLQLAAASAPPRVWLHHPRLTGHPAGVGWGVGRACVINCECEIGRVAPGDVVVTRAASPALVHFLPAVSGIVAERGGSTSHLASLARERGIPMVLGVADATLRIPDGARMAVDGVAGVVQWMPS
jgi:pyruvate, water dikinase